VRASSSYTNPPSASIRALNDELRQNFAAGIAVMTPGVAALGPEAVKRIVKTIAVFDDFCHANDPHEEHDFGSFEADGHTIMFKIDYFDQTVSCTRPIRPIPLSPSWSSPSCWRRSISLYVPSHTERINEWPLARHLDEPIN
jgi:hypothetical protein